MRKLTILLILFAFGCNPCFIQPENPAERYTRYMAINRAAVPPPGYRWSRERVEAVIEEVETDILYRLPVRLEGAVGQLIPLPSDLLKNGMRGTCLTIAILELVTLKRLGCPFEVEVVITRYAIPPFSWWLGHAWLEVRYEDGPERYENAVYPSALVPIERLLHVDVLFLNEKGYRFVRPAEEIAEEGQVVQLYESLYVLREMIRKEIER